MDDREMIGIIKLCISWHEDNGIPMPEPLLFQSRLLSIIDSRDRDISGLQETIKAQAETIDRLLKDEKKWMKRITILESDLAEKEKTVSYLCEKAEEEKT